MAIQGNLKTFHFASLLQLLCNDQKTGVLHLRHDDRQVEVFLRQGDIVYASAIEDTGRLGNLLRSEGVIDEQELSRCLERSRQENKRIGQVLLEQGAVSEETLKRIVHLQIELVLYGIFLWNEGSFEYTDKHIDLDERAVAEIDTLDLILEASRRVDELAVLKNNLPGKTEVLKTAEHIHQRGYVDLTVNERAILSLVNERRSIQNIINDSGYDDFTVFKILYSLFSAGLIEKTEQDHVYKKSGAGVGRAPSAPAEPASPLKAEAGSGQDMAGPERKTGPGSENQPSLTLESCPEPPVAESDAKAEKHDDDYDPEKKEAPEEHNTITIVGDDMFADEPPPEPVPPGSADIRSPEKEDDSDMFPEALPTVMRSTAGARKKSGAHLPLSRRALLGAAAAVIAGALITAAFLMRDPQPSPGRQSIAGTPVQKSGPEQSAKRTQPRTSAEKDQTPKEKKPPPPAEPVFYEGPLGFFSVNIPPGYRSQSNSSGQGSSVTLSYPLSTQLTIQARKSAEEWAAEDQMFDRILHIQKISTMKIQRYQTIKRMGCQGYFITLSGVQAFEMAKIHLYEFGCYDKRVSVEITCRGWTKEGGKEFCRKLTGLVDKTLIIYP